MADENTTPEADDEVRRLIRVQNFVRDSLALRKEKSMADENTTPEATAENATEPEASQPAVPDSAPAPANASATPAPASDPFSEAPKRRGRPPLSDAEKEVRRLDRQILLAQSEGIPNEILNAYKAKRDALAATIPPKAAKAARMPPAPGAAPIAPAAPKLSEAAIKARKDKLEKVLEKTFAFVGEAAYAFACDGKDIPQFPSRASEDLASAWVDIVDDYMPEHGESILKWSLAVAATGKVALDCKREIDTHNEKQKRKGAA